MPKADEWVNDTLTLCGREIAVKNGVLPQAELLFYPENPRLYSIIHSGDDEPSQAVIEKRLSVMDHVKQLVQSIRANGGLTDPLIVRDGDHVVLEGNSRLAAYRILARMDAIKWGMAKVRLLPHDIGEDLVFALLGEYHIIGKKDWAPYEQAGYLYRRHTVHGIDPAKMAEEMGLSTKTVSHLIKVYAFMVDHKDNDVTRWSYYDEYLKHNAIKRARQDVPALDKVVVQKIKSGEIPRAVDVREKLTTIAADSKVLATFVEKPDSFDRCYERAISRGVDNEWCKRLHKFRTQLTEPDMEEDLREMEAGPKKKCVFELHKIKQAVDHLLAKIEH